MIVCTSQLLLDKERTFPCTNAISEAMRQNCHDFCEQTIPSLPVVKSTDQTTRTLVFEILSRLEEWTEQVHYTTRETIFQHIDTC